MSPVRRALSPSTAPGRVWWTGWLGVWLLAGLAMSACAPGSTQSGAGASPAPQSERGSPTAAAFHNPVWDGNFPDPMIIAAGEDYLAVATNGSGSNVQTLTSSTLVDWQEGPDALPELAEWSAPGKVWAPEIAVHAPDRYVLYYTTMAPNPAIQCISVAVGERPEGPYTDSSSQPLVCEEDQGGSIDAHPFTASDGQRYLYWKNDGNAVGMDTYISVQQLDPSGEKLIGQPQRLFKQDLPWEGSLVEAPFVWEQDGIFHLFYSANAFDSDSYAIGHARSDSPLGPFVKSGEPVIATNDVAAGPGHCALFEKDGTVWMVYHAWPPEAINSVIPGRNMWLSEVTFTDSGDVRLVPPTVDYPRRP